MNSIIKIQSIILLLLLSTLSYAQEVYTLERCKELALRNNAKSQNSLLSLDAATQTKKEAFTQYFPSISAMGIGFQAHKPMLAMDLPIGEVIGDPSIPPVSLAMLKKGITGGITLQQPIFAGGQIITWNKLAKIGVEVSRLQKTMSDDKILITVEEHYWQIVNLGEKIKTIAEAETLLNRIHEDVNNSYTAGVVNKNDLLKVELRQNELESTKLKISNGLRLSKMVLAQYVGVPYEGFEIDRTFPETEVNTLNIRVDHQEALQQRAEYQLLDKNIEAGKMNVRMEIGKNLPTVAVGANWSHMNIDKNLPMSTNSTSGVVFGTVSIPISSWWGGSHAIKRQRINVQIAENYKRDAEEMLLIEMQQLWNDLEEASFQVRLSDKAIASALENVRLNADYYKAGTGLLTDLLDAQSLLQQARDQNTEAMSTYRIKLSKYRQATGQKPE